EVGEIHQVGGNLTAAVVAGKYDLGAVLVGDGVLFGEVATIAATGVVVHHTAYFVGTVELDPENFLVEVLAAVALVGNQCPAGEGSIAAGNVWRRAPADAHQRYHGAGVVAIDGVQVGHVDPAITIVGHHVVGTVVDHHLTAIGEAAQVSVAIAAFRQASL